MARHEIPRSIVAKVATVISDYYTHKQLDYHFSYHDCPAPVSQGTDKLNKYDKCFRHLMEANKADDYDAVPLLGALLYGFMEDELVEEPFGSSERTETIRNERAEIVELLGKHGFAYREGGKIASSLVASPTRDLEDYLRGRDLDAVDEAFRRAEKNIADDPPAALDAACSIVEACCKVYIEEHQHLAMPKDKSIKPVWRIVQEDLGWDPKSKEDDDIKRILGGLASVVDGIGGLRTKAGASHGRGKKRYRVEPRHARLAVHAAHSVVMAVLEAWEAALERGVGR